MVAIAQPAVFPLSEVETIVRDQLDRQRRLCGVTEAPQLSSGSVGLLLRLLSPSRLCSDGPGPQLILLSGCTYNLVTAASSDNGMPGAI